jgi:hypothetical protein
VRDDRPHRSRLVRFTGDCPSGKRGYPSRAKARKAIKTDGGQGGPVGVYRCTVEGCDLWHLTSSRTRS